MLLDLRAAEALVDALEASAPEACRRLGGGAALLRELPGGTCGAGFWAVDMRGHADAWAEMAAEQQAPHRAHLGE